VASIRVLICDSQRLVRTGFRKILEAEEGLQVVGEADDGQQAVEVARRLRPDVVLMEIGLPKLEGIEATRLLAGPDVQDPPKVVMLATVDVDEQVLAAFRAGAIGFLLKSGPSDELIRGVRSAAAGEASLAPAVARRLVEWCARDVSPRRVELPATFDILTRRELEVLRLIAEGFSNAEIASVLQLSEATVKSHVSGVLAKLGLRDRVQAVVAAYRTGLVGV
jgi:DNA-binding NarL/FixJ family response regulator